MFIHEKESWSNTQAVCAALGGFLVEIISRQENVFIKEMMREHHVLDVWLGASDSLQEGEWFWSSSGSSMDVFSDWAAGQPEVYTQGHEDCLDFALGTYGHWNDAECAWEIPFICQK